MQVGLCQFSPSALENAWQEKQLIGWGAEPPWIGSPGHCLERSVALKLPGGYSRGEQSTGGLESPWDGSETGQGGLAQPIKCNPSPVHSSTYPVTKDLSTDAA